MQSEADSAGSETHKPGDLLEMVARELMRHGLEVRKYRHGDELVEIATANPTAPHKGEARIGYDGKVNWEYSGDIESRVGIEQIRDTITGLLIADVAGT